MPNAAEHISAAESSLADAEHRADVGEGWSAMTRLYAALAHALIALAKRP